jgi:hypothetical protein
MNDLNRALGDIRDIRRQVAQNTEFRGYGPLTLGATAALAALTGVAQAVWLATPALHPVLYVAFWTTTAILAVALIATETLTRAHRMHSGLADEMIRMAALQFVPALLAGCLFTLLLLHISPHDAWLLPALWQILSSLGTFASCRFLPRPMAAVGVWYLISGLGCVALGPARALSPIVMAAAYGIGQSLFAYILYSNAREIPDAE